MNWIEGISEAIKYIEANLTNDLKIEDIAAKAYASPYYFQKSFSLLCGFTIGEYIRNRRLASAGNDLLSCEEKVIDIALKYGYDSVDSFTKAFTRFHGATPAAVRKSGHPIKSYAPLKLELFMKGGYIMDYRLGKVESCTIRVKFERDKKRVVCLDDGRLPDMFFYSLSQLLAEKNEEMNETAICKLDDCTDVENYENLTLPSFMWACFKCEGISRTDAREKTWKKIKEEWLPQTNYKELSPNSVMVNYTTNDEENDMGEIFIAIKEKGD